MKTNRTFGVVVTGRADRTPLTPVIDALRSTAINSVSVCNLESLSIAGASAETDRFIRERIVDVLVILGDRYESLAAATAATYHRVPIAHIHGGECSFGSFDNQLRDAISKLSHIHFVANKQYKKKLLRLNEDESRIHVVGAPGLDNFINLPPRNHGKQFVVTWHPETLGDSDQAPLIEALNEFTDYRVIWTAPNNDPGGKHPGNIEDLPFCDFIEACRSSAAIVGNSSSGIIEAPSLGVPTVNIGSRQDGRIMGPSVFTCVMDRTSIVSAIKDAIKYKGPYYNPYGLPGASKRIAHVLNSIPLEGILVKRA